MSTPVNTKTIIYPDTDGKPMADNTWQFRWIVMLKSNLDWLFRNRADVLVAGDLLWYPVEGEPKIRVAPDVLVAFGRPRGDRGSYRQWEEGGVAPSVVMEVLSPGNRFTEMMEKLRFYERYGVAEYWLIAPESETLEVFVREGEKLEAVEVGEGWRSPQLGVRVLSEPGNLRLFYPEGSPFQTFEQVSERAEWEAQRAEAERVAKEAALAEVARLKARLRDAGLE